MPASILFCNKRPQTLSSHLKSRFCHYFCPSMTCIAPLSCAQRVGEGLGEGHWCTQTKIRFDGYLEFVVPIL
jgi:hypothetical protein